MQIYSDPSRAADPHALPDVEVFYQAETVCVDGETMEFGWYYWPCFPGCVPDGEAIGPFDTESEAVADATMDADA
jgi:hypothetical protein